jgi:AcrR family transcriptional regulator
MPDGSATLKKGRKFDQVIAGAREVFLRDGFEGASVDDIAKAAGVSKATLYSYFSNKQFLFMEVAQRECERQAAEAIETIDLDAPIAVMLTDVATQLVAFMTSSFGQSIFRVCVGEASRFPALGQAFYESGPMLVRNRVGGLLQMAVSRGDLVIDDFDLAADQLAELCKADLFPRMVFNIADTFSDAEKERVVTGAVQMFMARYGTK